MTLKFDRQPKQRIGNSLHTHRSYVCHFVAIHAVRLELSSRNCRLLGPCELEICWMTLKHNRAYHPGHFKLSASFRSHLLFHTGVTVRRPSIRVKIVNYSTNVTKKFDGWPWKTTGNLFWNHFTLCSSFRSHLYIQTGVTIRERQNLGQLCFNLCNLDLWYTTFIFCMAIPLDNGNNSWIFRDDKMVETLS